MGTSGNDFSATLAMDTGLAVDLDKVPWFRSASNLSQLISPFGHDVFQHWKLE